MHKLGQNRKTKTSDGPLKNGDGVLISDDLEMSEMLNLTVILVQYLLKKI